MARRKPSRRAEKPEKPAALAFRPETEEPRIDVARLAAPAVWRDFVLALLLLLAAGATAFIWLGERPSFRAGVVQTGIVWIVTLVGLLGRLQARYAVCQLRAIVAHGEIVAARLAPDITEEQSGLWMRHVPAWLIAALGIAASAVLWQVDAIEGVLGDASTLAVGATISVMLALAVAANAVNRLKARRLARDFRAALNSERLALDTLGSLDVMISACLPTGDRTRFSESFLKFVGRTAAQMQGRGWLEVVHPEDREAVLEIVSRPVTSARAREHDICVRHRSGDYVWLHETLVPRFDDKGALIEFIGTASDITARVETETALHKQIADLKADLTRAEQEAAETKAALAEARSELAKVKASRNRFEASLAEAREEIKTLQAVVDKADARIAQTKAEAAAQVREAQADARTRVSQAEEAAELRIARLEEAAQTRIAKIEEAAENRAAKLEEAVKSARQEQQLAAAECRKLQRAFEKIQEELGELRLQNASLREQVARHMKEAREAKAEAVEAQRSESQHRARSDRLTQRCEELAAQLAAKEADAAAAQAHAREASASAAVELRRRLQEVSAQALATQLRRQLDGTQRMIQELLATAREGPVQDAANNTAATVRAMGELVDQALSGAAPRPAAAVGPATTFDLRRTAQGVLDLLGPDAAGRGIELRVETAPNLRPVYGDELALRTALLSLTDAALSLVEDGALVLRLSEDVNTAAHSTIRCELSHPNARVRTEALEAALAIRATDDSMPDAAKEPVAHQAAKAWRTIRMLEGQHGFQLPAGGGFSIWFTFTLERPAATQWQRPTPVTAPAPVAAPAAPGPRSAPQLHEAAGAAAETDEAAAARPMPRMPQEFLHCNLGEVVELGAGGMRVFCAKPPRHEEVAVNFDPGIFPRTIRAEVTWSKKIASRKHDVGLRFLGLTQEEQKQILRIAMQHRKVMTLLESAGS